MIRRYLTGGACLLVTAVFVAVAVAGERPSSASPAGYLLSTTPAIARPVGQYLGSRFTLSPSDRALRVVKALTADLDADGDLDAIGATRSGKVVVWINVGNNRLERRTLKAALPGQARFGRPAANSAHTRDLGTVDDRWQALPSRVPADTPAPPPPPVTRASRTTPGRLQLNLPPRAPPAATRSSL